MYLPISLALCIVSTIIFIIIKTKIGGKKGVIAKAFASLMFVMGGVLAFLNKQLPFYAYFFLGALIFSFIGDILLGLFETKSGKTNSSYLLLGIAAFSITQILNIVGMSFHALNEMDNIIVPLGLAAGIGIVIALLITVNSKSMGITFGKFTLPATIYSCFVISTFIYAIFLTFLVQFTWSLIIATTLFLASDLILSFMYFGDRNQTEMDVANKVTYYLAQIMYVVYLFEFIF